VFKYALSHENMCVEVGIHTFLTLDMSNQLPLYSSGQNPWRKLDSSVSCEHARQFSSLFTINNTISISPFTHTPKKKTT